MLNADSRGEPADPHLQRLFGLPRFFPLLMSSLGYSSSMDEAQFDQLAPEPYQKVFLSIEVSASERNAPSRSKCDIEIARVRLLESCPRPDA
jgi:hypothetical protein